MRNIHLTQDSPHESRRMIYIATTNYFLWHSLQLLIKPAGAVWISDTEKANRCFSARDILIVDIHSCPVYLLIHLNVKAVSPTIVLYVNQHKLHKNRRLRLHGCYRPKNSETPVSLAEFVAGLAACKRNRAPKHFRLSARESTVLCLSLNGMSARAIADDLGITLKTVYTQRQSACIKLGMTCLLKLVCSQSLENLLTDGGRINLCGSHRRSPCRQLDAAGLISFWRSEGIKTHDGHLKRDLQLAVVRTEAGRATADVMRTA
nr:helix-turn-helix transcriptional regulator [uncultured Enterobacter sp.]